MPDEELKMDDQCKAFLEKFSWEAYPSKHLKYFEIGAFDLEASIATDEVVHITDQKMSDDDAKQLAKALKLMKPTNVKSIYVSNNDFGDEGAEALASAAAQLPNFELFYVAVNKIGDAGVSAIAEQLKSTKVWQLVLTETNCGDKGAAALAVAGSNPEHFASLRWLFLDSTEIGDKGVDALSQAFVTGFQSIERLALQNTKLTNKGLTMLADAISKGGLPKCEYIYVMNNDFDKQGKVALKQATKPRGIKVNFGWPPPLPGVDYD